MKRDIITFGGLCAALLLLFAAFPASAHLSSDSYLRIDADDAAMSAQWDIALRDLDVAIGLDADGDGAITWGEVKAKRREIEAYALSRLSIEGGAGTCRLTPDELLADRHADGGYAVLRLAVACPAGTKVLTVRYRLLFDLDPTHRGLLTVSDHGSASTAILSPTQPSDTIVLGDAGASGVLSFVRLGVEHILGGRDHLLFLAVLLLPALRQVRRSGLRIGLVEAAGLLSLFTLAHAVTVTLAVLRIIEVPARLSEAAIAFSIAVTAADNIRPFLGERRGVISFGFGLIHGLGFASALGPLALTGWKLVLALAGFNTGIELVQLSLALIAFAAAWALARFAGAGALARFAGAGAPGRNGLDTLTQWRRFKEAPIICSLMIFALSAYWFADRAFLGSILR